MRGVLLKAIPKLVGLLFVWAAIYKLIFPGEATLGLFALGIPFGIAELLITAVIVLEMYVGLVLIVPLDLRFGLSAAMILMFIFAAYMWYLATLANPPSCGCLGLTGIFKSNKHAALFGLLRNVAILFALKVAYDNSAKIIPGVSLASGPVGSLENRGQRRLSLVAAPVFSLIRKISRWR